MDYKSLAAKHGGINIDAIKPTADQAQQKGFFGKTAGIINKGVGALSTAVDYTGAPMAVGAATGAVGGLIGGAVGAVGTPIVNAIQGKPLLQDLGKNIKETASSTTKFGYEIGHSGTETAPLGAIGKLGKAGRVANLAIAYGQGYQGANDVITGIKEGNPELALQGGTQLAASVLGVYSGAKGLPQSIKNMKTEGWKSIFLDPDVVPEIKKLQTHLQEKALQKIDIKRTQAANEMWRLTQPEIKRELQNGKNIIQDLKNSGVTSDIEKDASGVFRLSNERAISDLIPNRDAAFDTMQDALKENPRFFNYAKFQDQAIKEFKSKNIRMDAVTKTEAVNQIKKQVAAEIIQNAEDNLGFSWKGRNAAQKIKNAPPEELAKAQIIDAVNFNNNKSGFWEMSKFSKDPMTRTPQQRVAVTMGRTIAKMIEDAYEGYADIKQLNKTIGTYSDLIHFLQASEGRSIPKGSALRGFTKKATGALVGAIAGNALPVPGLGPVIGAAIGENIASRMTPNPGAKLNSLKIKENILRQKMHNKK